MKMTDWPLKRIPIWAYLLLSLVLIVITFYFIARLDLPFDGTFHAYSNTALFYILLYAILVIVCTTSLYLIYRKPYDLTVKIFFIFLQLFGIAQNFRIIYSDNPFALIAEVAIIYSLNLFGVVLLHFHLVFPKQAPVYTIYRNYLKLIYLIGFIFATVESVLFLRYIHSDSTNALLVFHEFSRYSYAWIGFTLIIALLVAIYQLLSIKSRKTKSQLRLVVIGLAFGLATPILFSFNPGFIWDMEKEPHQLSVLEIAHGTGTYIMTSLLAIAIFRYRIWNIEPFIKKAISYAVTTIFIYFVFVSGIYFVEKQLSKANNLVYFIVLAVSISIFLLVRDKIQKLIDRLFYRESYDSAKVVAVFEEKLSGIYKTEELMVGIVRCLYKIFHFKSFIFLSKIEDNTFELVYQFGLHETHIPGKIEFSHEMTELFNRYSIFSSDEVRIKPQFIESNNMELFVPVVDEKYLFGYFIFGPKLSERSYTMQDISVLQVLSRRVISLFQTAGLYQKELERHLMLEQERTRIAKDIHDEVGASLTRISFLSSVAKENVSNVEMTAVSLQQISEATQAVMHDMNQIIWALNAKNDTLEGLTAYIRHFAVEFLESRPLQCVFDLPEKLPMLNLKVEVRRNIYLIVREALNNVIKHAKASKVEISISYHINNLAVIIRDDGMGFDNRNGNTNGNGLINMKKRIEEIGGKFKLKTIPGKGTEISLSVIIEA